jgi:UDP-N-acetylmuramoylalanine--D-glutamate ligase
MKITDFREKKITVMGLGLHGGARGVVEFLSENGAKIVVTDLKSQRELDATLKKLENVQDVEYVLGHHREKDFLEADMVIKNPGIPWSNPYIQLALDNNIPVEMDSSLFFKLCKNQIIGVTGTRGKTTTASLICGILREAGKDVVEVGIGQVSVLDKLKSLKNSSIVVFEISSWRLSALGRCGLSPSIAVITNIFQDHLNYYGDMEKYVADKKYIFSNQKATDFCILNLDNEKLRELEKEIDSQIIGFSNKKNDKSRSVYILNNSIYSKDEENTKKIIDLDEIRIKGGHNISNIMASVGVAQIFNIDEKKIKNGILSFSGLPHRLEFVRELEGVRYYNDTAATSPDGAISGIESFDEEIVLIAGGSDKNLDMKDLARIISEKIDKIIFLKGEGTNKIIQELKNIGKKDNFIIADSMNEAVASARKISSKGAVVLLSPGTASFGLFLNEFDRGDRFKKAVDDLK